MKTKNIESELENIQNDISKKQLCIGKMFVTAAGTIIVGSAIAWFGFLEEIINRTSVEKAAAFQKNNNFKESIALYDSSIVLDSNNVEAILGKGIALREYGRLEEADKQFDILLERDSTSNEAWNNKGEIQLKKRNYKEALVLFDKADAISYENSLGKARAYHNLKVYDEALNWYNSMIREHPEDAYANYGKAGVLLELGYNLSALESIDKAFATNDTSFSFNLRKGRILFELKYYDTAVDVLNFCTARNPFSMLAWYNLGLSLEQVGHRIERSNPVKRRTYRESLKAFENALSIDPNYEPAKKQREEIVEILQYY